MRRALLTPLAFLLSCGTGALESPESLGRAVFDTVRTGNQSAFLGYQLRLADLELQCPALDAASRAEIQADLAAARDEAVRSFAACLEQVSFAGARFLSIDRSPSDILNFRWPSCEGALHFEWLRVHFDTAGTPGSLLVTGVAAIGGRWVFRGGVRLCEGRRP